MKSNWKKSIGIVAGIAIVALVVFKLKSNKDITQQKVYQYDKNQAIHIQVDTLALEKINLELSYSGTFEPNKESKISAEIQGKVNSVLVDVGSRVKKGQTLLILDNVLLKLQLQSIEVQIEGLEFDVKRYTILAQADAIQGIQLEKSILGLKSAKIQRATILEQINKTIIKAPFEGIVTAKLCEEGAFAAPGVPLIQLTDISVLKFTINISENELNQLNSNQSYLISADAYPDFSLRGKATLIGSKANIASSFPVQFSVTNTSDLKIKSGMFGKVSFSKNLDDAQNTEKGFLISTSSIIGSADKPQVYLVKNGKAHLQSITVSRKTGNKAVVSKGLKTNDVIITNGFINLFDGANVTVK